MVSIPDQNFLLTKMILRTIEDWSLRQTNRYLQYATKHLCVKKWNYIQKKTFLMMRWYKINFRALSPTKPLEKSKLLLKTSDAIKLKSNNNTYFQAFFFFSGLLFKTSTEGATNCITVGKQSKSKYDK